MANLPRLTVGLAAIGLFLLVLNSYFLKRDEQKPTWIIDAEPLAINPELKVRYSIKNRSSLNITSRQTVAIKGVQIATASDHQRKDAAQNQHQRIYAWRLCKHAVFYVIVTRYCVGDRQCAHHSVASHSQIYRGTGRLCFC